MVKDAYTAKLYATEKALRAQLNAGTITPDEFCRERRKQVQPVLDEFLYWLHR